MSDVELLSISRQTVYGIAFRRFFPQMEKRHADHVECFGVRHHVGDVVGCFLDANRHCISKERYEPLILSSFCN